ncbi:MAG: imidazolonepropionase [Saprospiraceae bacterium]|nr:imidazolonepropionase [Saprospiraceae bacterium]
MRILLTNINQLFQVRDVSESIVSGEAMAVLPALENAYLLIEAGKIRGFGQMSDFSIPSADRQIDCTGRMVLPAFCDSHSHIVFAQPRDQEFVLKIKGASYEAIAAAGGGILNSAEALSQASEADLFSAAKARILSVVAQGTGALEIKSGYGLSVASELKMLRVIQRLKAALPLPIKATFLGAHAIPSRFQGDKTAYMDEVVNEMLPNVAAEGLADYIDIFCERNYFDAGDVSRLLSAGAKYGLRAKVHTNQFSSCGGVQAAIAGNALTVDHLEVLPENDLEALVNSDVIPVALPGCSFFSRLPYTDARSIIAAGKSLALASDFNPGSAPSGNMEFILSLACIQLRLTPEEAINAMTLNGAAAMELQHQVGSISVGKAANLIITEPMDSLAFMAYDFGNSTIWKTLINGQELPS